MVREVESLLSKHLQTVAFTVLGILLWWGFGELQQNTIQVAVLSKSLTAMEDKLIGHMDDKIKRHDDIEKRLRILERHMAEDENGRFPGLPQDRNR